MINKNKVLSVVSVCLLTGPVVAEVKPVPETIVPQVCPVLESSDWMAWVNKMPGPDGPGLHVVGQAVLPTPGYTVSASLGPLDRRQPPTQRIILDFQAPGGMVIEVLSPDEINVQVDALSASYASVIILCGDEILAEITDIEVVQ